MFQRILVPVDSSQGSKAAAQLAASLARAWGSQVIFAHIYKGAAHEKAQVLLEGFVPYTRYPPELILEPQQITFSQTLVDLANRQAADLILIGVQTQAKLEHERLNSSTKSVSEEARIPVLIVPIEHKKIGFEARWASAVMQL